jgi:hypothetical protein
MMLTWTLLWLVLGPFTDSPTTSGSAAFMNERACRAAGVQMAKAIHDQLPDRNHGSPSYIWICTPYS